MRALILSIVTVLTLSFTSLGLGQYWEATHPQTGESALIAVYVNYVSEPRHPIILAVFPSGRVMWSVDYFNRERLREGGLPPEQARELRAIKEQRLLEIFGRLHGDSPEMRNQRFGEYTADPVVQDISSLFDQLEYREGRLDMDVVRSRLDELRALGYYNAPPVRGNQSPSERSMFVVVRDGELYKALSGPYGFYSTDGPKAPSWDSAFPREINWSNLMGHVLSIVDHVDPDSIETHVLTIPRQRRSTLLFEPDGIDLAFPPPGTSLDGPGQTGQLLAAGLAIAEVDTASGISYLRSALPVVQDEQWHLAYRALGYLNIRQGDASAAEAAFAKIANREVQSDALTLAEANIRMGYLAVGRGDAREAEMYFSRVALGSVSAMQAQVEEAAYRFARLLHRRARGNRAFGPAAANVYGQLAESAKNTQMERNARLQLSGLLFELAKGDYGEVDEKERLELLGQSRAESAFLIEDPDTAPEDRAVAELMYLETFYYQDDQQKCLDLGIEFVDKWTVWRDENPELVDWNINTHLSTAHGWALLCAFRLSEYELAIDLAGEIRELYDKDDPYDAFNVFGYSLLYEAFAQEALGDYEMGQQLRTQCREEQRDWYETIGLREARNLGLAHSMLD